MTALPDPLNVLNELLATEECSLASRLIESTVFVSRASVRAQDVVNKMALAARQNCRDLTAAIVDLGGQPAPRPCNAMTTTAGMHFQDLGSLLPHMTADQEKLIRKYAIALPLLSVDPKAASLASRIAARHKSDLQALRSLLPQAKVAAL